MKKHVVGIGRVNIDLIYSGLDRLPNTGEEVFSKEFGIYFGGGIPGEAIILSKLGIPAKALTWLGKGSFADFARNEFAQYGVDVINLYHGVNGGVTLSSTMVCNGERTFCSFAEDIDITADDLDVIREAHKGAGIILMGVHYPEIYRGLDTQGAIRIFDTGWHDDMSLADPKYRDFIEMADYYLPNRREALKITGTGSVEEAAEVLSRYFRHTIIKLDREGCLIKDENGVRVIPPMPGIKSVDSTGAGDAFLCGFTYGIYHHYGIDDCVRFGNITGGTCVQALGCITKTLTEPELLAKANSPK